MSRAFILRDNGREPVQNNLFRYIESLPANLNWQVTIAPHKPRRSLEVNAYYWAAVLPTIAAETGHTAQELHEYCKQHFAPVDTREVLGEVVNTPKSTTRMTTAEFWDYLHRISAFAADMGILIPPPQRRAS